MQQNILETFQAILFSEMPKNKSGNIIIFDREIKGWNLGDRKLKPAIPAITLFGKSINRKEIATLTYELEHTITIKLETGNDTQTISAAVLQEFERLVNEIISYHRQIWVMTACPFCMNRTLSPEHFILQHNDIFADYLTEANANVEAVWNQTHSTAMPALKNSRKAIMALDLILDDIRNNKPVKNITDEQKRALEFILSTKMKPVRLLYDVKIADINPTDNSIDKQTFHTGEISIQASELSLIPASGPDNVSTDSWSIR